MSGGGLRLCFVEKTEDILLRVDVDTAFAAMSRARNRFELLWTTELIECSSRQVPPQLPSPASSRGRRSCVPVEDKSGMRDTISRGFTASPIIDARATFYSKKPHWDEQDDSLASLCSAS